jgi:hypothetical protein
MRSFRRRVASVYHRRSVVPLLFLSEDPLTGADALAAASDLCIAA